MLTNFDFSAMTLGDVLVRPTYPMMRTCHFHGHDECPRWSGRDNRPNDCLGSKRGGCIVQDGTLSARADRDKGQRQDGATSSEREELTRLRRENRQLRQERDILAKATAWFARETAVIPSGSSNS